MPRDGSNVYHIPPGTEGAPDTVIESAKYNAFVTDVEQDLNAARPIIAGGTGATSAAAALVALGGEQSSQVVTNYDSHVFVAGSFSSASSATGSPVSGHAFAGIVYVADSSNLVIEARDLDDTTTPPRMYVRQKKVGIWSAWAPDFDQNAQNALNDTRYVNTSGDTMTGLLVLSANPTAALGAASKQYVDAGDAATLAAADAAADAADAALVRLAGNQNLTGGFSFTPFAVGNMGSGTITFNPMNGNYQSATNNAAVTVQVPTVDCAMDILVTNSASAGTLAFSGSFTVNPMNVGDNLTTTNGHRFIISIRRIGGISTFVIKALQ